MFMYPFISLQSVRLNADVRLKATEIYPRLYNPNETDSFQRILMKKM